MSALSELQAGTPSTAFTELLVRTVVAVGRRHGFPPPAHGAWTRASALDVAAEFVAREATHRTLEALVLGCADDRALAGALQAVIRNLLRDRGRATEVGRLVVRLRRALKDPAYQRLPGDRYAFAEGPTDPSGVPPDELVAATVAIQLTYVTWSPTARRRQPFASKESIDELVAAVMAAAKGSLRAADVAHAVAPSLQVVTGNVLVEFDSGAPPDTGGDIQGLESMGLEVPDRDRAFEVFGLLTDREKIWLGKLGTSVREIAPMVGLGHSQTALIRGKVVGLLSEELDHEENGQEIAELVFELAKFWVENRTGPGDVTYNSA